MRGPIVAVAGPHDGELCCAKALVLVLQDPPPLVQSFAVPPDWAGACSLQQCTTPRGGRDRRGKDQHAVLGFTR